MYKVALINDGKETVIHHPNFNNLKVTSGKIKDGINIASGFSFSIFPNNPGYNLIRPLKTLVEVQNIKTGKKEFEGRILMPIATMNESGAFAKSFICESELGYLNDSIQRFSYLGANPTPRTVLARILLHHNQDIKGEEYDKSFRIGLVTVEDSTIALDSYIEYEGTWDTIQAKLIDVMGGELRVRKENGIRYLDYVKEVGELKSTEIRLAKNLKTIQQEVDPSAVITRLVPLGKENEAGENQTEASQPRVTISEVNNGLDYLEDTQARAAFGIITKKQAWDDVEEPNVLKVLGKSFLVQNNRVKTKTTITALDLSLLDLDTDAFETGNYYPVINPVMGIDEPLRVVEKETDIINPKQNTLTLGDTFQTASKYLSNANKSQTNIQELRGTINRQNSKISSISGELFTTKEELSSTKKTLESYQETTGVDLTGINQQIESLLEIIEVMEQTIEDIQGIISTEQIQSMQQSISTMGGQITNINGLIEELTQRVTNLENTTEGGGTVNG
ncbi:phage tail spike protein [Bacillus sp. Au-Bac7]|uniref:phage tail spike protein n=1 Tax=Bacillus sp. Au-Bac7 TaxID=2906458 RepID=UPI001E4EC477|nr:phage tail spike protein [Bacillus sp. Au-Bac7]MCE4052030.1 phage tail protein [Bacillus sp. Au-Bac7]